MRSLWWWSFEITPAVAVAGGRVALAHVTVWWIASAVLLTAAVAVFVRCRSRPFVWAWSRCLVVRHRLRLWVA